MYKVPSEEVENDIEELREQVLMLIETVNTNTKKFPVDSFPMDFINKIRELVENTDDLEDLLENFESFNARLEWEEIVKLREELSLENLYDASTRFYLLKGHHNRIIKGMAPNCLSFAGLSSYAVISLNPVLLIPSLVCLLITYKLIEPSLRHNSLHEK